METVSYGYDRTFDIPFDEAVTRVTDALRDEGFGVLTEIDVKATLKNKLDLDFRRYTILGACNPVLAHRALEVDPHIGLLLPCNVVVQEANEGVVVSIADPRAMFDLVGAEALKPVVAEADERLRRVLAALVIGVS